MPLQIPSSPTEPLVRSIPKRADGQRFRVCSFESRRAAEMQSLIERQGGIATIAPSMREIPLDDNPRVFEFADKLLSGEIDAVIFLTGVGTNALAEAWRTRHGFESFLQGLSRCTVVVRGPKPAAVLRDWNVRIDFRAPEPNTWHEVLDVIDDNLTLAGKTVAVQEYGRPSHELYCALEQRGATVLSVPVYRWALPENIGPLRGAICDTIAGRFDVLLITSAQQVNNVLTVAESDKLESAWLAAARKCVVASIGPTASETLVEVGLPPDVEASHPKMGQLVRQALEAANTKLGGETGNPA